MLHEDISVHGIMEIAEFIEKTYPQRSLLRHGAVSYQEAFTVVDGNVTEMTNNVGERYVYTYDDHAHAHESEFCYEIFTRSWNATCSDY